MSLHSNHPFHLVEKSPWPLVTSVSAMGMVSGLLQWFHTYDLTLFLVSIFTVLLSSIQWWRDVSREGLLQGWHTLTVTSGLRWGMILFIVSEVLFFFSFFWAFFHSSLTPALEVGSVWPPVSISPFNFFQIPLLNTTILLASGVSVTWAHHAVLSGFYKNAVEGMVLTVCLGLYFTGLQGLEYVEASFSLSDSVYGSAFFVATGFHGLHVIIGTIFLLVGGLRLKMYHFSKNHHMGLEAAIWYWHFVDVVWLFLYTSIYWWGS